MGRTDISAMRLFMQRSKYSHFQLHSSLHTLSLQRLVTIALISAQPSPISSETQHPQSTKHLPLSIPMAWRLQRRRLFE